MQVKLSEYIGKKYVILFFYPLDFTFVCPTGKFKTSLCSQISYLWTGNYLELFLPIIHYAEITAFSDRYEEFNKLNTEVLGVSVDSVVCIAILFFTYSGILFSELVLI